MKKFIPFARTDKQTFERIEDGTGQSIYLLKRGFCPPKEQPYQLQQLDRLQAELQALEISALKALADAKNCTIDDASTLFNGIPSQGIASSELIENWLEGEDQIRYLELRNSSSSRPIVATRFLQNRLAYHVNLSKPVKARSESLPVVALTFPLNIKDQIRFGDVVAVVTEPCEPGDTTIAIEPLLGKLDPEVTGFLLDGQKERVGLDEWSEDDTVSYLSMVQINEIYLFYLREIGAYSLPAPTGDEDGDDEGKALTSKSKASSDLPEALALTGSTTTPDSKPSEPVTPDSTGTTSGTALTF